MKTAREIIAPIIEPVGFSMKPEDYGLETQEQFTRTLAYGSQLVAFDKADAILAALAAEGFSIVETGRDPVTIEACAKVADKGAGVFLNGELNISGTMRGVATSIRSLSRPTETE